MSKELGLGHGFSNQACACCKHQRKKCDETCELAPYFPASKYRDFQNAHRLFGASNIQKLMAAVDPHHRQAAADSILTEANARRSDPVHGCYGLIRSLKSQIAFHESHLRFLNQHLASLREQRDKNDDKRHLITTTAPFIMSSSSSSSSPPSTQTQDHHQIFDGFRFPTQFPDLNSEHGYVYQSTIEEGADLRPFDFQLIDQVTEAYNQHGNVDLASFDDVRSGESSSAGFKIHGKQVEEREKVIEEEEARKSSTKGKEMDANED